MEKLILLLDFMKSTRRRFIFTPGSFEEKRTGRVLILESRMEKTICVLPGDSFIIVARSESVPTMCSVSSIASAIGSSASLPEVDAP